jgi:hypothetical protein
MVGKRHASGEIAAKLAQANELAAKGKTQREISKALGVSIMTYHRWKKMGGDAESAENPGRVNPELRSAKKRDFGDLIRASNPGIYVRETESAVDTTPCQRRSARLRVQGLDRRVGAG